MKASCVQTPHVLQQRAGDCTRKRVGGWIRNSPLLPQRRRSRQPDSGEERPVKFRPVAVQGSGEHSENNTKPIKLNY
eukprot:3012141-Rhodomonas_salina.1